MGQFKPVFLAFLLNCAGVYIFTAPKGFSCFPFSSYFIFLLAVFFLLWDVKLKPVAFRKLLRWVEFLIEFIVNMMLMEIIMNNFWFPLEMAFLSFLPKISEFVNRLMNALGIKIAGIRKIFEFLKWHGTLWVASHLLSIFFFLCIIHATRIVDFRILQRCGSSAFLEDTAKRTQQFVSNMTTNQDCNRKPSIGGNGVEVSENYTFLRDPCSYDSFSSDSQDFCDCDYSSSSSSATEHSSTTEHSSA